MRDNKIETIENLENLRIEMLNLSQNKLKMITGLSTLKQLTRIDLSRNEIHKFVRFMPSV